MCPSIYSVFPAFHSFISSLFEILFPFTFHPSISSLSKYLFPPTFFLCNYPSLFCAPIYLSLLSSIHLSFSSQSSVHAFFILLFILHSSLIPSHSIPPSIHLLCNPLWFIPSIPLRFIHLPGHFYPVLCLSTHSSVPFFLPSPPCILSSRHPRSIPGGSHLISRGRPKEKRV